jgi:hypothetical protein
MKIKIIFSYLATVQKNTLYGINQHLLRTFVLELFVVEKQIRRDQSVSNNLHDSYMEFTVKDVFGYPVRSTINYFHLQKVLLYYF